MTTSPGSTETGRLPNFLYIGPDKAGSSWLHETLTRHPQIYLTAAKDLYFFDRYFGRGVAWYRSQFRHAGPEHAVVGEVCQDYLFHPEAAERIRGTLGDVKLMVTLREPAERAFSSYLYMVRVGERVGTFAEALRSRPELVEHSRYGEALGRVFDHFPRGSVHVSLFDDLREDPQQFVDDTTSWLGISRMHLDPDLTAPRLAAGTARFVPLVRACRSAAAWTRLHDGATLVGRVKRSKAVQSLLYRPLPDGDRRIAESDRLHFWSLLGDDIDEASRLSGLDLRRRWTDVTSPSP